MGWGKERKKEDTHSNLLPQKIKILIAVAQRGLGCAEFGGEEVEGFGQGVGEHYVGLFGCVRWGPGAVLWEGGKGLGGFGGSG